MAKYIERNALLKVLRGSAVAKYPASFAMGLFAAANEVSKLPAADVVPVVHGHWIPIKVPTGIELLGIKEMVVGFIRCSECYMEFDVSCEWYSHYCPNCGARMKEADGNG